MYHLNEEIEHIYESNMNTSMEETNELKAELVQKDQQIQLLTSTLQKQYEKNTIQNVSSTFETETKTIKRIDEEYMEYSASTKMETQIKISKKMQKIHPCGCNGVGSKIVGRKSHRT
jgi:signal recognition particle GTPase